MDGLNTKNNISGRKDQKTCPAMGDMKDRIRTLGNYFHSKMNTAPSGRATGSIFIRCVLSFTLYIGQVPVSGAALIPEESPFFTFVAVGEDTHTILSSAGGGSYLQCIAGLHTVY